MAKWSRSIERNETGTPIALVPFAEFRSAPLVVLAIASLPPKLASRVSETFLARSRQGPGYSLIFSLSLCQARVFSHAVRRTALCPPTLPPRANTRTKRSDNVGRKLARTYSHPPVGSVAPHRKKIAPAYEPPHRRACFRVRVPQSSGSSRTFLLLAGRPIKQTKNKIRTIKTRGQKIDDIATAIAAATWLPVDQEAIDQ